MSFDPFQTGDLGIDEPERRFEGVVLDGLESRVHLFQ